MKLSNRLAKALSLGVRARMISQNDLDVDEASIQGLRTASENAPDAGSPATRADLIRMWQEWDATIPDVKACAEHNGIALSNLSRLPLFAKPL